MNAASNPLLALPQKEKEKLFGILRSGIDYESIDATQFKPGLPAVAPEVADQFFKIYARERWALRVDRAAEEANALMELVRQSPGQIPEAVLALLGQEAFRQISSGKVTPEDLTRYTALFLRAREGDRAERALDLQNERLHLTRRNATEKALDAFARELPQHPAALEAFQNLKNQLLDQTEHLEDSQ